MTDREIHIALPWHALGYGNLGIDALTQANIEILRSAARKAGRKARFTTLCSVNYGVKIALPGDVTVGPMPSPKSVLQGRSEFLKVLRSADLVVDIGEGDGWTDIYSSRRFAFQSGTKVAALILGKPLVLSPQTIGPFSNPLKRAIANQIMSRATAVYARDDMSKAYLEKYVGNKTETAEFIDVAFRLPFEKQTRRTDRIRVGLNISGLLYQGGYTGKNEFGLTLDYRQLAHRMIEAFQAMPDIEVHLIPHVVGADGNDGDLAIVPDLTTRYPELVLPETFQNASSAKSYISGMDFMVGGRMHACIGAFSSGVPVVPIAYSRKFNGLFGTLEYPHYVDGKAASTDEAFDRVMDGFRRRDELSSAIDSALLIADRRLNAYEDRLQAIIEKID